MAVSVIPFLIPILPVISWPLNSLFTAKKHLTGKWTLIIDHHYFLNIACYLSFLKWPCVQCANTVHTSPIESFLQILLRISMTLIFFVKNKIYEELGQMFLEMWWVIKWHVITDLMEKQSLFSFLYWLVSSNEPHMYLPCISFTFHWFPSIAFMLNACVEGNMILLKAIIAEVSFWNTSISQR